MKKIIFLLFFVLNTNAIYAAQVNFQTEGGGGGAVDSVNSQTGTVVLDADDIDDTSTTHKFVTGADITKLSNTSGTNTGDQSIEVEDEAVSLTTGVTKFNFTGAGVTATEATDVVTVTIPGATSSSLTRATDFSAFKIFTPGMYSATCDGVADDTAALQSMITAAKAAADANEKVLIRVEGQHCRYDEQLDLGCDVSWDSRTGTMEWFGAPNNDASFIQGCLTKVNEDVYGLYGPFLTATSAIGTYPNFRWNPRTQADYSGIKLRSHQRSEFSFKYVEGWHNGVHIDTERSETFASVFYSNILVYHSSHDNKNMLRLDVNKSWANDNKFILVNCQQSSGQSDIMGTTACVKQSYDSVDAFVLAANIFDRLSTQSFRTQGEYTQGETLVAGEHKWNKADDGYYWNYMLDTAGFVSVGRAPTHTAGLSGQQVGIDGVSGTFTTGEPITWTGGTGIVEGVSGVTLTYILTSAEGTKLADNDAITGTRAKDVSYTLLLGTIATGNRVKWTGGTGIVKSTGGGTLTYILRSGTAIADTDRLIFTEATTTTRTASANATSASSDNATVAATADANGGTTGEAGDAWWAVETHHSGALLISDGDNQSSYDFSNVRIEGSTTPLVVIRGTPQTSTTTPDHKLDILRDIITPREGYPAAVWYENPNIRAVANPLYTNRETGNQYKSTYNITDLDYKLIGSGNDWVANCDLTMVDLGGSYDPIQTASSTNTKHVYGGVDLSFDFAVGAVFSTATAGGHSMTYSVPHASLNGVRSEALAYNRSYGVLRTANYPDSYPLRGRNQSASYSAPRVWLRDSGDGSWPRIYNYTQEADLIFTGARTGVISGLQFNLIAGQMFVSDGQSNDREYLDKVNRFGGGCVRKANGTPTDLIAPEVNERIFNINKTAGQPKFWEVTTAGIITPITAADSTSYEFLDLIENGGNVYAKTSATGVCGADTTTVLTGTDDELVIEDEGDCTFIFVAPEAAITASDAVSYDPLEW